MLHVKLTIGQLEVTLEGDSEWLRSKLPHLEALAGHPAQVVADRAEPISGGAEGVGSGPISFNEADSASRYEPGNEEPEPEPAAPGAVDTAERGDDPPRWKDVSLPDEVLNLAEQPASGMSLADRLRSAKAKRRDYTPAAHTKDRHHEMVAKGSVAKRAETAGPVVGGAPTMTKQQQILRLIAKQAEPLTRIGLLDAVMDADLASSRDSAYQQISRLRKQGLLVDVDRDGKVVVVLTDAGQREVRQCPSSAE